MPPAERSGVNFAALGSLVVTLVPFGGPFLDSCSHSGTSVGPLLVSKIALVSQRCPKRRFPRFELTLLRPFGDLKSSRTWFQRRPYKSLGKCLGKELRKGAYWSYSTCLNCVRGLKKQGFDDFRQSQKTEPNRLPFGHHLGTILGVF